jgi:hypothetical protein
MAAISATNMKFISAKSFWTPQFLTDSAWHEHAPFAFWLIEAHRPRTLVELGTYSGISYFCFCQAVDQLQLETKAFAVDTWAGDEHGGFYGEDIFRQLAVYNQRFSSFSSLVRSSFDEALRHFEDGSIDLLHIDGRHFYDDVKHDFTSWIGKLSDRAIVLFHDTNVRERDFGVFQFWREVSSRYPSFEFFHGHGLGVLGVGTGQSPEMDDFFKALTDSRAAVEIRTIYSRLGASIARIAEAEAAARQLAQLPHFRECAPRFSRT